MLHVRSQSTLVGMTHLFDQILHSLLRCIWYSEMTEQLCNVRSSTCPTESQARGMIDWLVVWVIDAIYRYLPMIELLEFPIPNVRFDGRKLPAGGGHSNGHQSCTKFSQCFHVWFWAMFYPHIWPGARLFHSRFGWLPSGLNSRPWYIWWICDILTLTMTTNQSNLLQKYCSYLSHFWIAVYI